MVFWDEVGGLIMRSFCQWTDHLRHHYCNDIQISYFCVCCYACKLIVKILSRVASIYGCRRPFKLVSFHFCCSFKYFFKLRIFEVSSFTNLLFFGFWKIIAAFHGKDLMDICYLYRYKHNLNVTFRCFCLDGYIMKDTRNDLILNIQMINLYTIVDNETFYFHRQ